LNEPLEASRFRLEPPEGAEMVTLGDGSGESRQ
jgi:hypothetical protein